MLAFTAHIKNLSVAAVDGTIGAISDLYFDDRTREVRWAVIDTGTWLPGRRVLLPASHLQTYDREKAALRVDLARQAIAEGPGIDVAEPVSRQMEKSIYGYYNWAPYWGAPSLAPGVMPAAPMGVVPMPAASESASPGHAAASEADADDPHLRSASEVIGYYVASRDGNIGHIEDLLVEPGAWRIRGLVIDTRNWWPGRKVEIPADRLLDVSWSERTVRLDRSRGEIERATDYDPRHPGSALLAAR